MTSEWIQPFRRMLKRVRLRLNRNRLEQELQDELEFHRERKAAANLASGLDADSATRLARRQMGNITVNREECREMWSFVHIERLWADLRHAFRMYSHTRVFAATCVLSIAVGIGGNAAMFSLVNALLLKPLPYRQPDRLVRITGIYPRAAVPFFQSRSRAMDVASVSAGSEMTFSGDGQAATLNGSHATTNFLGVLGMDVALGRGFEPGEDRPGKDGVILISHSLWKERFQSDPAVVGRAVLLDGMSRQIIGVMPGSFVYPSAKTRFWIPMRLDPANFLEYWGTEFMPLLARLRPTAHLTEAQSEARLLANEFQSTFPYPMRRDFYAASTAIPLQSDLVGEMRDRLLILVTSVATVLLIACANVSSMLLSRAAARRKEMALRSALGAGRGRVIRQMLTESILLAGAGALLGLFVATFALALFKAVLPASLPGVAQAGIDWQVLAAACGMALISGIIAGLAPALNASRLDVVQAIRTGGQRSSSPFWTHLRNSIITGQVALTLVLLVSAGLLLKSVYLLSIASKGFDASRVVTVRVDAGRGTCPNHDSCVAFFDRLQLDARGVSGVVNVAFANSAPLDGRAPSLPVEIQGWRKTADTPAPLFWLGSVTPEYFSILHIPLVAGRYLTSSDRSGAERVAVVSASTASRYWPQQNPIGRHIRPAGGQDWHRVVGVVGEVQHFRLGQALPSGFEGTLYLPYAQTLGPGGQFPKSMSLVARTAANDLHAATRAIRELVRAADPNVPASQAETLDELVLQSTAGARSTMLIFSAFAAVAVLLAAVGIYGLMAYWVGQRRYEIGLRMAVGSSRLRILCLVLSRALRLAAFGVGSGLVLSLLLTRFLSTQLYGVGTTDTITLACSAGLLLAVAGSATVLPAWRAIQVDPAIALRTD